MAKEGFLKGLFEDLHKDDDVLVQLNAIEIVSNLAEAKHGSQYLSNLNILTQMDVRLNVVASGSTAHFLMPGYIKFFGRLAHHDPQRFQDLYPNFTSILMNMLNNSQEQEGQLLALEVFGHIALRNEGKKMLLENNRVHEDFFQVLRNKIKSGTSETRVRALGVFADIIRSTEQEMVPDVSRQLFEKLDGVNTMIFITNLARKPFSGILRTMHNVQK